MTIIDDELVNPEKNADAKKILNTTPQIKPITKGAMKYQAFTIKIANIINRTIPKAVPTITPSDKKKSDATLLAT